MKRLAHNLGKISKGREPRWFEEVCAQVMSNENPSLNLIVPNPFTIRSIKNETTIKNLWVTNNVGLVGRVRKIEDNLVTIRHWHKEENKITKACSGCNEHISSRTNAGVIKIHTRFLSEIVINRQKVIYSNIQDITKTFRIKKERPNLIPREPFIGKKLLTSWKLTKMFTNIENEIWKKIEKYGLGTEEEYEIVEEKRKEDKNESSSIFLQMRNNQESIQLRVESCPTKTKTALTGIALMLILSKEKKVVRIKTNI